MALLADDRNDGLELAEPRSTVPPPRESVLDKDVISLCARQHQLIEYAFRLADHGHTHVGNLTALSRYTLLDIADGHGELVDGLERLLGQHGLSLANPPARSWQAPPQDLIDGQLD